MLDFNNIDLILWDLDGVIYIKDMNEIDVLKLHTIFGKAINKMEPKISEEEGLDIINKYYPENPARFYHNIERDFGIDKYNLDTIFHELLLELSDFTDNTYIDKNDVDMFKLIPGKHFILTQSHKIWAKNILEKSNLLDFIENIISSQVTLDKPKMEDNDLYLEICSELGINPTRAVMIEDSHKNLIAAKKHGLQTVLFNYGRDIDETYIDYQYRDIKDFLSNISK